MPDLLKASHYFKRQQEANTCSQNQDGFHRLCDTALRFYNGYSVRTSDHFVQNGPNKNYKKGGVTLEECKAFCEDNIECAAFATEHFKLPHRKPYNECLFYKYPKIGNEYRFDDAMLQNRAEVIAQTVEISVAEVHRQADINLYVKKGASVEEGIRHAQQQPESVLHPSLKCKRPLHIMRIDTRVPQLVNVEFTMDGYTLEESDFPMKIHFVDTTTGEEVDPTTVCSPTS